LRSRRTVNLWRKNLVAVPDEVWDRTDTEALILADNALTALSPRITALTSLAVLDLGHNRLSELPDALGDLTGLTDFLYLHDNQLATLPSSLARLDRLRYLNISDNRFLALPEWIGDLRGLIELRVSNNTLQALPDSIARLTCLRELHLRDNQLRSLPESIVSLRDLRHLDLRGNPLEELPPLTRLPRLAKLDLRWVTTLAPPSWLADLEEGGCAVYW
jgi:Leucine-rich repeat (LRR) protein